MKKMIILMISMVVLLTTLGVFAFFAPVRGTASLPRIWYTEAFEQEEEVYFVYFWRNDCPRCAEFEPYVVEAFNERTPVYVVDMNHRRNQEAWYQGGTYRDEEIMGRSADMVGSSHYLDLTVEGTPTIIKIEGGIVVAQAAGVTPAVQLLDTYER